jgi:membrane fusion protein, copper/silver efflux system
MKKNWNDNRKRMRSEMIVRWVMLVLLLAGCAGREHTHEQDTYTCPMHPTVVSDKPGVCPVCAMDLVRKARPGEEVEITEDLARLIKSPNEAVVASVKTVKGEYKSVSLVMDVQGVVTYDTRNIYSIPSRAAGRLEKIYLKYAFQPVSKGQMVAELYSPELLAAQRELLFVADQDKDNTALFNAARSKLSLLGMTNVEIESLLSSKQIKNTFRIYSAYSGYLITDQPAPTTSVSIAGSSGDGMGGGMSTTQSPTATADGVAATITREGSYVSAGQTLFNVVNTSDLRIELDLPASQMRALKVGDPLELNFGSGLNEQAAVDFVQPFFNSDQEFVKVRVRVSNKAGLHIGHLVTAKITMKTDESLWVPQAAVVDLGRANVVFVKDRDTFRPVKVGVGVRSDGMAQIMTGLASSDEIAGNAQYLVDSESFIGVKP